MEPLRYEKTIKLQENQSPLTGYTGLSLLEAIYQEEKNLSVSIKGMKAPRDGVWLPTNGIRSELEEILRQFKDTTLNLSVNVAIPNKETPDVRFDWNWVARREYNIFPNDYIGNLPQIDIHYTTRKKKSDLVIRVAGFSKVDVEKAVEKIHEILFPDKT